VGGNADIAFSARVIAATNRALEAEVKAGRFREDLFYRLNVIQLRMPPLRERRGDIPVFLEFFLQRFTAELGRSEAAFSPEALEILLGWQWPGNIRELANVVERAATLSDASIIGPEALPPALRGTELRAAPAEIPTSGIDLQAHLDAMERRALEQALERTGGNKTEAAKLLALTFRSLRYRLAKFGIGGDS
jgi:two-component system response regulator PilR (NtrC family)